MCIFFFVWTILFVNSPILQIEPLRWLALVSRRGRTASGCSAFPTPQAYHAWLESPEGKKKRPGKTRACVMETLSTGCSLELLC